MEVPTVGWSLPCCPLLSPYSCPASAEVTSWRHIRSVTVISNIYICHCSVQIQASIFGPGSVMLHKFTSVRLCCFQVSQVFDLESSACSGELMFMERYKEVLQELEQVEQKMENQSVSSSSSSSEGLGMAAGSGAGRCRLGSSGRSTLQAIGSAAAAGVSLSSCPTTSEVVGWGCDSFSFSCFLQV